LQTLRHPDNKRGWRRYLFLKREGQPDTVGSHSAPLTAYSVDVIMFYLLAFMDQLIFMLDINRF
jgi:hypothetical protein